MTTERIRVAITGAAGQIGYALLFRIASGQMFGPNTEVELNLLELESSLSALNGVAMELEDCAFPLLKGVYCTSDPERAMAAANWALLVGSMPRKQGMERADLLANNGAIFTKQGKAINDHAADNVRVFVVGNPCNTNCLIAMHNAPDIPADRFFAMTTLDELRARAQLAQKAGVDVSSVRNMSIWGNHSATQFPDFYHAQINNRPATEVINDQAWLENDFIPIVQQRGAAVIKARGSSSAASAANAIVTGVSHLVQETPVGDWYSMCRVAQGEYGVDPGLIFSFPCVTENGVNRIVEGLSMNEDAKTRLNLTLNELRAEYTTVKSLGLLAKA